MSDEHKGLPVHGYKPKQPDSAIRDVNRNKLIEELCLRRLDQLRRMDCYEGRNLSLAKTYLEEAFMRMNRAIFQPERIEGNLGLEVLLEEKGDK